VLNGVSLMNVLIISAFAAFVLGLLSKRHNKVFGIFLLLSVPLAWAIAKFSPMYTHLPRANHDGFLNFYIKLYERATEDMQQAVLIFPVVFIGGRIMYHLYKTYFYVEKVETPVEKKKRVRAMYGVSEWD